MPNHLTINRGEVIYLFSVSTLFVETPSLFTEIPMLFLETASVFIKLSYVRIGLYLSIKWFIPKCLALLVTSIFRLFFRIL